MKLTYTIAAALMLATSASAEATQENIDTYCTAMAELAEGVMGLRQSGLPLRDMLERADAWGVPYARTMVIRAYETPRFTTDDIRAEVVLDFGTAIHLLCLEADGMI